MTASETEADRAWAELKLKQLTGGDRVAARFMRQDFFTYKPQFKLNIIGNHMPVLHNVDDAMRRRIIIVPFIHKPEKPDRDLEDKLLAEAAGILRWMIDGCLDWQKNGLIRPDSVQKTTSAYFANQDLLSQWIEECCEVRLGDRMLWDRKGELFASWIRVLQKRQRRSGITKSPHDGIREKGLRAGPHHRRRSYISRHTGPGNAQSGA